MISRASRNFWKCFEDLPENVQRRARAAYLRWRNDPFHPGLHFKKVHTIQPVYSVRISRNYRALGLLDGENDVITWF